MNSKLHESIKERKYQYKNRRPYVQDDKVWYQNKNSSSWTGPGIVINHDGSSVWIRSGGDIKKVAQHRVQPYGSLHDDSENLDGEKKSASDEVETPPSVIAASEASGAYSAINDALKPAISYAGDMYKI